MRTNSQLKINTRKMNGSLEKLSSGYRINKAADDAAGMAISRKMKTQIAGLDQASRNASDGISVIQTAEGALTEVHSMLQRMRELSVEAANGTLTEDDRQAIQDEINQLCGEIDRISTDTEFNTKTLLDGSLDRKSHSSNPVIQVASVNDKVSAGTYIVSVTAAPGQAEYTGKAGSAFSGTAGTVGAAEAGTISINGESITIAAGDTREEVIEKLRDLCERTDVTMELVSGTSFTSADAKFKFTSEEYGADNFLTMTCNNSALASALGIDTSVKQNGKDAELDLGTGFTSSATVTYDDKYAFITDYDGFKLKLNLEDATAGAASVISVFDAGPMLLQVGANEHQTVSVTIPEVSTTSLGVDNVNVMSDKGAQSAISKVDAAVNQVSEVRAKLGAYQNRLESSISNLDTSSLNLTDALSRIEDLDMAEEMTKYTQYQVLVQASTSMLAQANEQPQTVLSLLQA